MYKRGYKFQAIINFILGACAIMLYLPYTFKAFNVNCDKWIKVSADIFKNNYSSVLIWFGIILLTWFIVINTISLFYHASVSKIVLKICVLTSLMLPLVYVMALKFDWALNFWIEKLASNIKIISYALLCSSIGGFVFGLILNFGRKNKANINQIMQSLIMVILLTLMICVAGWCGWDIGPVDKLFGVLMGLFAIYLPVSIPLLFISSKARRW